MKATPGWRRLGLQCCSGLLTLWLLTSSVRSDSVDFRKDVWPILRDRCVECHGENEQSSSLRVDSRNGLTSGGDSGPAIVPGDPDASLLLKRVAAADVTLRMPLDQPSLTSRQIATLRQWVLEGADWPEGVGATVASPPHWAFKPVVRPEVPSVAPGGRSANPIDAFVSTKLEEHGLQMSPPADPRTFIRRVTLDLTGLPPRPEDVEAFLRESDPGSDSAVGRLVDRLLGSPAYGERWAQHWLDVIRYADTQGYESNDIRPSAWPYRDYVIAALNADIPYPQFLLEQLAGDVVGVDPATGFLVTPPIPTDQEVGQEPAAIVQARMNGLDEVVQNVGSAVLGLTVGCARCHNHKFDPVTVRDYYRFVANFSGLRFRDRLWQTGARPDGRVEAAKRQLVALREKLREFDSWEEHEPNRTTICFPPVRAHRVRLTVLNTSASNKYGFALEEVEVRTPTAENQQCQNVGSAAAGAVARSSGTRKATGADERFLNDAQLGPGSLWISESGREGPPPWVEVEWPEPQLIDAVTWHCLPEGLCGDNIPVKWRIPTAWRIEIADADGRWSTVVSEDRSEGMEDNQVRRREELEARYAETARELWGLTHVFAGRFTVPDEVHVLRRGDPQRPQEPIAPGGIDVLGGYELPRNAAESERRLALARWLGSEQHPLTARVIVNRVWHHHFGTGLVATPSDFGKQGEPPSHPELLEWLASDFMARGWRLKDLHRMICTSATYRQSSRPDAQAALVDADARFLWRFPPRRLEAEAIRDSMLFVSGSLDPTMGGPGVNLYEARTKENQGEWRPRHDIGPESWRRSIYLMKVRGADDGVFKSFDIPDCRQVIAKRSESTTPLQALNLLNSDFVVQQAERFAARVEREVLQDRRRQAGDVHPPRMSKDIDRQLERVFLRALCRPPNETELSFCRPVMEEHGLAAVCRAVLNSNEFLFIE